jgi:hypothetical protein
MISNIRTQFHRNYVGIPQKHNDFSNNKGIWLCKQVQTDFSSFLDPNSVEKLEEGYFQTSEQSEQFSREYEMRRTKQAGFLVMRIF